MQRKHHRHWDFQFARNRFRATVLGFENRSIWEVNTRNRIEWGAKAGWEQIEDVLGEAVLSDSAGTMTVNSQATAHNQLSTQRFSGYLQHTFSPNNQHRLTYGARMGYWTLNGQWLVSPTLQYAFQPDWEKEVVFKFAAGVYRQPPFYRELRAPSGQLNENLKAQSSLHIIGGAERRLKLWGRDFFLTSEAYYKKLWDVVAYDVENVRLRYYANNYTQAYAFGGDIRLSGEFVKGAESWFSLGVLNTKEDLSFDQQGHVRRPTDQRLTASVFFQDHLPGNPTLRVYLNGIYGSGLPFGPPRNLNYRSAFTGPSYRRVDIGFSKIFRFQGNTLESLWIGAEVLNLLGSRNVLSYTWIHDIGGSQYAVPNSLSARFLNARMILKLGRE